MNRISLLLAGGMSILGNAMPLHAADFPRFLDSLAQLPVSERQVRVDRYLADAGTLPLTEDTLAHFIYSGTDTSVAVAGDFNGWNPVRGAMRRVEGTNLWYRTETLDRRARLDYKIVLPGSWILDPRNPYRAPGGFGENSELRMPGYVAPAELVSRPTVPRGRLIDTLLTSKYLGNSRSVTFYLPPGYKGDTPLPLVLVHDGADYIALAKMNTILDNLIAEKKIRPVIAVFVPPVERNAEYIGGRRDLFASFIVDEVLPFSESAYRIERSPASRAMIGSSAGANIALAIALRRPGVFGMVGLYSPYVAQDVEPLLEIHPALRVYVCHGTYDFIGEIQRSAAMLRSTLRAQGYDHLYEEYPEGHSYGLWRAHIDDALKMFFPQVP